MRYSVIMCGGVGSRFWPFSRTEMPKQFLDFFGTGRSLLQMTVDRILPIVPHERIVIVTNESYLPLIREQLPEIDESNILLEPARRNTAPCICWAAHHIYAKDPDASMSVLPSDHLILKENAFLKAMEEGLDFVENNDGLLTLGIKPTAPETGYGYIQRGNALKDWPGIMKVKSFTEKPDKEMARMLLASGDFSWNSGIFLWTASSILKAFRGVAPEVAEVFDTDADCYGTPEEPKLISRIFPSAPSISIDYAVMEKAPNVFVKTVDLGWSDLGTWKALYGQSEKDEAGNAIQGCKILADDCQGSLFALRGDKVVVAAGLKDYIVAENGNALLIVPIDKEQEIRRMVNDVRDQFGDRYI